jgi:hypothetical protein
MMSRKYRMGKLEIEEQELTCARGDQWPPMEAKVYGPTAEDCRPHVSSALYTKIRVWEQACGLFEMSEDKCPECPFVKVNGELAKPFGTGKKIHTTSATRMANALRKKHS